MLITLRIVDRNIQLDGLVREIKRLRQLGGDLDLLGFASTTSAAEPLEAVSLACKSVSGLPRDVADGVASFLEVLEKSFVELGIVSVPEVLHYRVVAEERFQHGLRLEHGLDFVLQLHLLDVVLNFLVCEQELSDFNFVLHGEALA